MIDEEISTTSPTSDAVTGSSLRSDHAAFQFAGATTGDYTIELQAAAKRASGNSPAFVSIGEFDQSDEAKHIVVDITSKTRYRCVHISGVAVQVTLAG